MLLLPPAPAGKEAIRVRWDRGGLGAESYEVWRKREGEEELKRLVEGFSQRSMRGEYVDEDVSPDVDYTYRVIARNAFGESQPTQVAGRIPVWPESLALGAAVTASSSSDRVPAHNAVDGKPGTVWVSAEPAKADKPQWLEIDLGREQTMSCLTMVPRIGLAFFGHTGPQQIAWQVAAGDGKWRDVASMSAAPDERAVVRFDPVVTQRIRLLISSGYDPRNVGVAEIGVFGPQPPTGGNP
jgi:hypothetical protein